jgi:hypothetical protein
MNNSYPKSWSRIMTQTIAELNKKKNLTRLDLKRGALALVKGLNVRNKKINAESEADYIKAVWDNFQLYEMALSVIGMLTPKEVIETFPIYKRYDGHKYETKDYFSVQERSKNASKVSNKISCFNSFIKSAINVMKYRPYL